MRQKELLFELGKIAASDNISSSICEVAVESVIEITHLQANNTALLEALEEIEKGRGAFSMDPLEHCANCVEECREIARAAIARAKGEKK